jgi:hypothetical protein
MGGACSTYGGGERGAQGVGGKAIGKEAIGEILNVDGRIILGLIFRKMEWGWGLD